MKWKCAFLTFSLLCLSVNLSAQYSLSEAERRWLHDRSEIIFVGQIAYPPFEFIHPRYGEYTGMAIELIRWIATEYGFTAVFRPMPFASAQQAVTLGTADALTGIFESEERKKRFDFTSQVFAVPASIFVRSDRTDILELDDLTDKKVAVQRGDYAIEFFSQRNQPVEWIYTTDFQSALNLVALGEADALIGDEQVVLYYMYNAKLQDRIKKVSQPLYIGKDCMAVAKGNSILHSILQKGLNKAKDTGVLDTIYQKWLGVAYVDQRKPFDRWRLPVFVAAAMLLVLGISIVLWTMQLRRLVVTRTAALTEENERLKHSNESLSYANGQLMKDMEERARLAEESRRLESRMIKAQNNESLALMAGNIAHEFNNMLMGIIAAMELPLNNEASNNLAGEARLALENAVRMARKAGELARRMMEFAGQSAGTRVAIDLNTLAPELPSLLTASNSAATGLQLELAGEAVTIKADPGQLKQVLLNILLNAVEASPDPATPIQLRISKYYLKPQDIEKIRAGHNLNPDTYALIEIRDQGIGMDPAMLERIFEPYYTTKRSGRGLGLAATAGIVKAHGGAILVDSARLQGSAFSILLPLVA